ncbi:GNAT family N-acetyltransferase [Microcella sp.]|uniref:GNAT family N-acetyltransferase n=1 Tax=Microcella sp. TaxID=1913979 RepID=UPI00391AE00B
MTDDLRPLRDRVTAPAAIPIPVGPAGIHWRPLSVDDAEIVTELAERISARDHPTWSESLDEIRDELGHSWVDPGRDGMLALDADGTAVAWGLAVAPPDPESLVRVILFGGVDAALRGRGIGRRLLAWQHERARAMLANSDLAMPAWVLSYAADRAPEHGRLLLRAGFEPARYFTTLEVDLAEAAAAPPVPEGVAVVAFDTTMSERVRAAKNAAFADHWGSQPASREGWESMQHLPSFRADLSRVALVGDEVVGFVITEVNEDDWERQGSRSGYIGLVGTVRDCRGRGLASALLGEVLEAYREADLERAVLDVDADNPTGALGVYTRLGFAPTARDVSYRVVY